MDSKFYVSLEAARLLKEKGYDRECIAYYQNDEFHPYSVELFKLSINDKNAAPSYMNQYSAPTKAEAIDWLESKGMTIDIHWIRFNENRRWNYSIFNCSTCDTIDTKYICTTRLEAEEAAIIKACEFLENGN